MKLSFLMWLASLLPPSAPDPLRLAATVTNPTPANALPPKSRCPARKTAAGAIRSARS